jgi:hypothetical protein
MRTENLQMAEGANEMNTVEVSSNIGNFTFVLHSIYGIGPVTVSDAKQFGEFYFNIYVPGQQFSMFYKTDGEAIMQRAHLAQALMDFKSVANADNISDAMKETMREQAK